jgi:hypothetical protein
MSKRFHFSLFITFCLWVSPGLAAPPTGGPRPEFTAAEETVIHRNSTLERLAQRDPWLVRQVLDAIAKAESEGISDRGLMKGKYERPPEPGSNPDLDRLSRASPEAAHDLFQLIKKASTGRKSN